MKRTNKKNRRQRYGDDDKYVEEERTISIPTRKAEPEPPLSPRSEKERCLSVRQGEMRFIQEQMHVGNTKPVFIQWVKKKNRLGKIQDRLLVIGKYRIFSIKRPKVGFLKVVRHGHLYDIAEVFTADTDSVIIRFKDFKIDVSSHNLGIEAPAVIMTAFSRISTNFPSEKRLRVVIDPPERGVPSVPTRDPGPAGGYIKIYKALCDYCYCKPNSQLLMMIKEAATHMKQSLKLDLVPGVEIKSEKTTSSDLEPALLALRYNEYFTSVRLRNVPRKEGIAEIAGSIRSNNVISKIVMSGLDAEWGYVHFGEKLSKNKNISLTHLDFSGNNIKERGILGLKPGLQVIPNLKVLKLSNCQLNGKAIAALFDCIREMPSRGKSLEVIDISHNDISTKEISMRYWLEDMSSDQSQPCLLKELYLGYMQLSDMHLILEPLRAFVSLKVLDLSGNKIDESCQTDFQSLLERTNALEKLVLKSAIIKPAFVAALMSSIRRNDNIDILLDVSGVHFGPSGAAILADSMRDCKNIHSLCLADTKLKSEGITHIIDGISRNTTLREVDLSYNLKKGKSNEMVVANLAAGIKTHPNIVSFHFKGRHGSYALGKAIRPLFCLCDSASSIEILDISGHEIGEPILNLFDYLRTNKSLKCLRITGNHIDQSGFRALGLALKDNKTLYDMAAPKKDMSYALSQTKEGPARLRVKKNMLDLWHDIGEALYRNAPPEFRMKAKSKKEVLPSAPSRSASTFDMNSIRKVLEPVNAETCFTDDSVKTGQTYLKSAVMSSNIDKIAIPLPLSLAPNETDDPRLPIREPPKAPLL